MVIPDVEVKGQQRLCTIIPYDSVLPKIPMPDGLGSYRWVLGKGWTKDFVRRDIFPYLPTDIFKHRTVHP